MKRLKKARKSTKFRSVDWQQAPDIAKRVSLLVSSLEFDWIKQEKVHSFRSQNSKSRAIARIWGLPRVWQMALGKEAAYILEVISERFDKLSPKEQDKVLLHELAHIPKNFSGSLVPHSHKRKGSFRDKLQGMLNLYENYHNSRRRH